MLCFFHLRPSELITTAVFCVMSAAPAVCAARAMTSVSSIMASLEEKLFGFGLIFLIFMLVS